MRPKPLVLTCLLLASFTASASQFFTGEVLIQNDGPNMILAHVQDSTGTIVQEFRLVAERPFPQNPVWFRFQNGEVTADADRITILDHDGSAAVVFALLEDANAKPERPNRDAGTMRNGDRYSQRNVMVLHGYEIGHNTVDPGYSLQDVLREPEEAVSRCIGEVCGGGALGESFRAQSIKTNSPPGGTNCNSGGQGSTSCSIDAGTASCSVTCSANYYACCNFVGPACRCFRDL
jgi:hypothetical protein